MESRKNHRVKIKNTQRAERTETTPKYQLMIMLVPVMSVGVIFIFMLSCCVLAKGFPGRLEIYHRIFCKYCMYVKIRHHSFDAVERMSDIHFFKLMVRFI